MIKITQRTVIGPILVPDTPDCDYNAGEELLSNKKIEHLKQTFKDYNIIDYQHQFTDEKQPYFMQNIGTPKRLWYNDKELSFEDVTGATVTVPPKTLWLESNITDERVVQEIDDKEIVAYSVTVSEKSDAEQVMQVYNKLCTKNANKQEIDLTQIVEIHNKISSKRTLIKDIQDPVLLTTSVVKFPCVNKAKFCKNSLKQTETDIGETMNEKEQKKDNANKTFIESIQDAVNKYRSTDQQEEEVQDLNKEDVTNMIDEKIGAVKEEITAQIDDANNKVLEAIKGLTNPDITEEDMKIIDDAGEPTITNDEPFETEPVKEKEPEPVKEPAAEPVKEEEPEKEKDKTGTKGKGGKARKHEAPLRSAEPSAQPSRKNANITTGETKMTIKRNENEVIYDAIKNGLSTKSINMEEVDLTGTGLSNTYQNEVFLSLMNNKYAKEVYKASFSEENTNKAILSTAVFSTFVSKLIQDEPIFQDCKYETGHHGKGYIYELGAGTYDTEDGHLPENFYFDKDPADDEFDVDAREVRCYTQRRKVTISDRQRLANVYGDDLVNRVLEISRKKLFRGVYAARIWSDTTAANSVDIQYRRQDGLLKQAGQQLTSGTDFDTTKASKIFEALYYALPEEAQNPSDYVFYVPANVHRAYNNEINNRAYDTYLQTIGTNIPLTWNDIQVKVSPGLNRADMKELVYGEDSAVLLTAPENTNLFVGREAGIELKRNADTSSDTFYETIDTGVAYSIPDYAVVGKIAKDDYDALIETPTTDDNP